MEACAGQAANSLSGVNESVSRVMSVPAVAGLAPAYLLSNAYEANAAIRQKYFPFVRYTLKT
jgi:hypothetical protein